MSISLHNVVVLTTLLFGIASGVVRECVRENPCKCNAGVAWSIDLAPLNVGGRPRYSVLVESINATSNSTIFFHPCENFWADNTTSGECGREGGVAVCLVEVFQNSTIPTKYTALGVQVDNTFATTGSFPNENVTITYTSLTGAIQTTINLKCNATNENGNLTLQNRQADSYALTLSSLYSCANAVPASDNGLSVGSVLLILFFVVLMLYLIVGMIYKRFVMGASGFEIIPNYEFWIDFPFLLRDGLIFICKGCKTEPSYDRI